VNVKVAFKKNGVKRKPGRLGREPCDWMMIGEAKKRKMGE
jgi:hypothetical protein